MAETLQKEINGFRCKILVEKQTLQIMCVAPDNTYYLCGLFSADNIPESIKNILG